MKPPDVAIEGYYFVDLNSPMTPAHVMRVLITNDLLGTSALDTVARLFAWCRILIHYSTHDDNLAQFPTIDRAISHGDDPYNATGKVTPFPGWPAPAPEEFLIEPPPPPTPPKLRRVERHTRKQRADLT